MIKITNLMYQPIINNFNLEVNNKVTCLIGPSGCGKTTLFKILINQITDYQGETNTKNCAYLPQNNLLLNHLTIEENIKLVTKNDVSKLLEKFNLEGHKYPTEISGGMKSKVSIIRTLSMPSDSILFDEPFTGIDILTKFELLPWLKEQIKEKSVLYITHDIHEALAISDEIILVDKNMNIVCQQPSRNLNFDQILDLLNKHK